MMKNSNLLKRNVFYIFILLLTFGFTSTSATAQINKIYYVGFEYDKNSTRIALSQNDAKQKYNEVMADDWLYLSAYFFDDDQDKHFFTFGLKHMEARKSFLSSSEEDFDKTLEKLYSGGRVVVGCGASPFTRKNNIVTQKITSGRNYYFRRVGNFNTWLNWAEKEPDMVGAGVPYLTCEVNGSHYVFFIEHEGKFETAVVWAKSEISFRKQAKRLIADGYETFGINGSGGWRGTFIRKNVGSFLRANTAQRFTSVEDMQEGIESAYYKGYYPVFISMGYSEYINLSPNTFEDYTAKFD